MVSIIRFLKYTFSRMVNVKRVMHSVIVFPLYLGLLSIHGLLDMIIVVLSLIIFVVSTFLMTPLFTQIELRYRQFMIGKFIIAGRGLSTSKIRLIIEVAKIILVILITNTTVLITNIQLPHVFVLSWINIALSIMLITLLIFPIILIQWWISQRKINIEIEIPYVLVLLRVLSTLRIPLYEMLQILETSTCLNAFPRELKLARKISSTTSMSLITSIQGVTEAHPSRLVRDLMTRIFNSVSSIGDVKEVIDRVFDNVFQWYESRISGLIEKFTMITGTAIFVYFFIPLIATSIIPIYIGSSAHFTFIPIIGVQLLAFLILYGLISKVYPSSLVIKPTKTLSILSVILVLSNTSLLIVLVLMTIDRVIILTLEQILIIQLFTFTPMVLIAEQRLATRNFYDRFIVIASDALNLAATTGVNPASVLLEIARKHGRRTLSFTKTLISSYGSKQLRTNFVRKAPTIYHASFIESLMIMMEHGWTSDSIRGLTHYYERLRPLIDRLKGFSVTLEYVLIFLAGLMGGFLEYMKKIYISISELYVATPGFAYQTALIQVDPILFYALDCIILLSFVLISMIIGKTRGGSIVYMSRSAMIMLLLYALSKTIISILLS